MTVSAWRCDHFTQVIYTYISEEKRTEVISSGSKTSQQTRVAGATYTVEKLIYFPIGECGASVWGGIPNLSFNWYFHVLDDCLHFHYLCIRMRTDFSSVRLCATLSTCVLSLELAPIPLAMVRCANMFGAEVLGLWIHYL